MAFISNENRESLIKKINKSYGFRKFLICLEMALLIGFIIVTFVSISQGIKWWSDDAGKLKSLTALGIGMLSWAILMTVLGIITMVLILTLKSPKKITEEVSHLESSAISGKKIKRTETSVQVIKDRTTSIANKPKAKKSKK